MGALGRQLAYMNDFGALLGTATGMAFSLMCTIPRWDGGPLSG